MRVARIQSIQEATHDIFAQTAQFVAANSSNIPPILGLALHALLIEVTVILVASQSATRSGVCASTQMISDRDFVGRRWLSVALRSLHLAGVVAVAVGVLGGSGVSAGAVALMLLSGFALYGLDLWHHPDLWTEAAGIFILVKLLVMLTMLLAPDVAGFLFWLLVISSSVVSHAPYSFRHRKLAARVRTIRE